MLTWKAWDYCTWFASVHGWTPDQTMRQPVGLLDRLVATRIEAQEARRGSE